jgi:ribosomal protein S18 acetylase RimI-like enzyme
MDAEFQVEVLNIDRLIAHRDDLIDLLQDVVDHGASVSFVSPLAHSVAEAFWRKVESEVAAGQRIVIAAWVGERVVGCVQLALSMPINGAHRAEVQKLLVHSAFRQRGIAKTLLTQLDREALSAGRTLLVLDTEQGSVAEAIYERYGYQRAGVIPNYAMNGAGEKLIATVIFYRELVLTR